MPKEPHGQKLHWDIGEIVKLIEEWEANNESQTTTVNALPTVSERPDHG
jgi:hypothetical protein